LSPFSNYCIGYFPLIIPALVATDAVMLMHRFYFIGGKMNKTSSKFWMGGERISDFLILNNMLLILKQETKTKSTNS